MRGSCAPCPITALTRLPRAPWEKAPAGSPKRTKYGNEESYSKVQGSAGEGRHGICGMPGDFARSHDGGLPVEGGLRRELGSHDAAKLVGGMYHGNGCRNETSRLHAVSCIKTE